MSAFSIQLLIILHIIFSQNPIAITEQHPISSCSCNLFKMPVKNSSQYQRQYRLNKKRKRAQHMRDISRKRARRIAASQNTETETFNNSSIPAANE